MRLRNRIIRFALAAAAALVCLITGISPAEGAGPPMPPGSGAPAEGATGAGTDQPGSRAAGTATGTGTDQSGAEGDRPSTGTGQQSAGPERPVTGTGRIGGVSRPGGPVGGTGSRPVTRPVEHPTARPTTRPIPSPATFPAPSPTARPVAPPITPPSAGDDTLPDAQAVAPTPTTGDLRAAGVRLFHGWAFDVCSAPDLDAMRAWRHSAYRAVGTYVGGRARSCQQPNLNRAWVRAVARMGWRILPVYVGSQSPCARSKRERSFPIDAEHAGSQGASEAADAARSLAALGLARRTPVFLDIEAYDVRSPRCTEPVLTFMQGWNRALRARGYVPGFYSSAETGIAQLEIARRLGRPDLPALMWFARWNVDPDIYGEPKLPRSAWRPHRRVHQFAGEVRESHGGRALTIDRDLVDAPVAIVNGVRTIPEDPDFPPTMNAPELQPGLPGQGDWPFAGDGPTPAEPPEDPWYMSTLGR